MQWKEIFSYKWRRVDAEEGSDVTHIWDLYSYGIDLVVAAWFEDVEAIQEVIGAENIT